MKKILLILLFLQALVGNAQSQITSFYSVNGAQYAELTSTTPSTPIDQSPNGPNAVWNFSNLTIQGFSVDSEPAPTSSEISTYPNTTNVSVNTATIVPNTLTSTIYSKKIGNQVSITGIVSPGFNANFSTDDVLIGNFPLSYGAVLTDNSVAGTYVSGTYSGTLTGTSLTAFDGYGTMSLHIDSAIQNYSNVTRYKSVQNINLNYGVLSNVGTAVRTTISYFDTSNAYNVPVFKSTITVINVPLLSVVNQTTIQLQRLVAVNLNNHETVASNDLVVYPNPVKDQLKIATNGSINILNVVLTDLEGREVLHSDYNELEINVSSLQNGVYLAIVKTDKGIFTQKIIKQ
jgi:hypothetical protein